MTIAQQKKDILKVCRSVRRWVLEMNSGGSEGMCTVASSEIYDRLKALGIKVKIRTGVFKIDHHSPCHDEVHTWIEWRGLPIDVTADQFNSGLHVKNRVKAIIFHTHKDRFLTWGFRRKYK